VAVAPSSASIKQAPRKPLLLVKGQIPGLFDVELRDTCSYQQIDHTYSGESPEALCRAFYQFMMACGFAPQNVSEAMLSIGTEYDEAYSPKPMA